MRCFSASDILPIRGEHVNIEDRTRAFDRTLSRQMEFGASVLGPIFAEFALRLWIFLNAVEEPEDTCILFCARGGLRLRLLFERFLKRAGLESPVVIGDVMVSRLIAARMAILDPATAVSSEIGREFYGGTMQTVAHALAQQTHDLEECWQAPFDASTFDRLLGADLPGSRWLTQAIEEQNALFLSHLRHRSGGRRRIILCDTGLYGSTLRWLERGLPHIKWSCVLLARSNYKGFPTEHFARTRGLSIEQNGYIPSIPRTAVFRFWHLIESVLEPRLQSVKSFRMVAGSEEPRSNLEIEKWEDRLYPDDDGDELFAGVLDYFDQIRGDAIPKIYKDAARAWRRLRRIIVWPKPADVELLTTGDRSCDFGSSAAIPALSAHGARRLRSILRSSIWREGEIVQTFPVTRSLLLAGIEGAYVGRYACRIIRRLSRSKS